MEIDSDTSIWLSRDVGYTGLDLTSEFIYSFSKSDNFTLGFDYTGDNQNLQTHYLNKDVGSKIPLQGPEYGKKDFNNTGSIYTDNSESC